MIAIILFMRNMRALAAKNRRLMGAGFCLILMELINNLPFSCKK